jgi:hypothetical protein
MAGQIQMLYKTPPFRYFFADFLQI